MGVLLKLLPLLFICFHGASAIWTLKKIATQFVAADYINAGEPQFTYDGGAANKVAYDSDSSFAYVGGNKFVQVIDYSRIARPDTIVRAKIRTRPGPVTDIAECGWLVAWITQGHHITDPGTIHIYDKYRRATGKWNKLCSTQVGAHPVSLKFTHQCSTIVIANKGTAGERVNNTVTFENPEGSVTIIKLQSNKGQPPRRQPPRRPPPQGPRQPPQGPRQPPQGPRQPPQGPRQPWQPQTPRQPPPQGPRQPWQPQQPTQQPWQPQGPRQPWQPQTPQQPPHGHPPHGHPPHGHPPHGQPPHGQPPHGQPPHGQPPHGQPPHGQPPRGQPPVWTPTHRPRYQTCGPAAPFTMEITTLDFAKFNNPAYANMLTGVRTPYDGSLDSSTPTFAQALEPHYITLDPTFNTAYISLRENNALVQVNLERGNESISAINPFGVKRWFGLNLDATNLPNPGVSFGTYDIMSLRQPGAIEAFVMGSGRGGGNYQNTFLVTADEGATTSYTYNGQTWKDFTLGSQMSNAPQNVQSDLGDPAKLGNLEVSTVDGRRNPNDPGSPFQNAMFFGSRGISLFRFDAVTSDLLLEWDSGDTIAREIAAAYPQIFNSLSSTPDSQSHGPASQKDQASMKRGAACKSLALGYIDRDTMLLFVGVDGPSVIAIFSISRTNSTPVFQSVFHHGAVQPEFSILMGQKKLGDVDPVGLRFISSVESVDRRPYLMVTGGKSGTVSMLRIENIPRAQLVKRQRNHMNSAVGLNKSLSVIIMSLLSAALIRLM